MKNFDKQHRHDVCQSQKTGPLPILIMIYLILDTKIWIYLANGFDSVTNLFDPKSSAHLELYEKLKQKTDDREFIIMTNYIIKLEWERNKKSAFQNIANLNALRKKEISQLVSRKDESNLLFFESECRNINDSYNNSLQANLQHIENIENFLNSSLHVPVSDKVKLELAERAIAKDKSPFLSNKNNFADAAILLSTAEFLKENMDQFSYAVFVSNNHKDFGRSGESNDFHQDLESFLKEINIEYHKHLNGLLDLTEELQYTIESFHLYQSRQDYYFSCLSPECETLRGPVSFGCFTREVRSASCAEQNSDQLNLFEGHELQKYFSSVYVKEGNCQKCNANRIQYPSCSALTLDFNEDSSYYCSDCEKGYRVAESLEYNDRIIYQINENQFHL